MGKNTQSTIIFITFLDSLCEKEICPEKKLRPIHYYSPIASAQVKSCILFAGLMVIDMALLAFMATRYKYVNFTNQEKSA